MTESKFTSKLLKRLREHPRLQPNGRLRVIKHSNSYTGGIPDFSVTIGRTTTWWEVKRWGNKPTKLQQEYLDTFGLDAATTITFSEDGSMAIIGSGVTFEFSGVHFDTLVEKIVSRTIS